MYKPGSKHNVKFAILRSLLAVAASSSSSAKYSPTLWQNSTHLLISVMIQTFFPTFFVDIVCLFPRFIRTLKIPQ